VELERIASRRRDRQVVRILGILNDAPRGRAGRRCPV